jgi:DHA3 family macrolide efflux protein-like MFS transporter
MIRSRRHRRCHALSPQQFSPAIAGLVVEALGLSAAFVVELVTCAVAAAALAAVDLPAPPSKGAGAGILSEGLAGLRFVLSTVPLRAMLALQMCGYVSAAGLQVLTMPMLLTFTDAATVGLVLTVSGCGAIVGTALAAALGPRLTRPALAVAVLQTLQGALMVVCALRASTTLVLGVAFVFMLLVPSARACREAVWQALAPADILGRVLVLLQTLMQAMLPLSGALLGPLADGVFEPRLQADGAWSDSVGAVLGTGPGRGCAALMACMGIISMVVALSCALCRPLREITLQAKVPKEKST